jgi:hypothetical protein
MSSAGTPGYPAPLIACMLVTITALSPNRYSRAASGAASITVVQLGFVTMAPGQPRLAFWKGRRPKCSGLSSGMRRGTSSSILKALALENT